MTRPQRSMASGEGACEPEECPHPCMDHDEASEVHGLIVRTLFRLALESSSFEGTLSLFTCEAEE